jgi:ubiquinone/menaquinone biosynthesis C-methylase UbiE
MEDKKKPKKELYTDKLNELSEMMDDVKNTPMSMYLKIINLIIMNMRYEKIAYSIDISEHPYILTREIIQDTIESFKTASEILFIESESKDSKKTSFGMEDKHHDLWNNLWNKYDPSSYQEKVDRYSHRIKVNELVPLIKDRKCIDLGSGHGTFSVAMAQAGAFLVEGIDFSEKSVEFAKKMLSETTVKDKVSYQVASNYKIPFDDDSFDFAVQNGVFHHMDDEKKAIDEAKRILKKGGYFWYYTDGQGGISYDLWDESVHILRDVPIEMIQNVTRLLNVSVNKSYHLGDGLKATYRHTNWEQITDVLKSKGFGNFKRMKGGFPTDMDGDIFEKDPYAKEKFGEGDLRILAQLNEK